MEEIESDLELQRVLWACYKYWQESSLPLDKREIWHGWVVGVFEAKFGTRFHQSKLRSLAKLGFLSQADTARGGGRRYYKLIDPNQVHEALKAWGMV